MNNPLPLLLLGLVLCALLLGFSFIAAPRACEWGWRWYIVAGLVVVVSLTVIAWYLFAPLVLWQRVLGCVGYGLVGGGVWVIGVFAANFKIICRLI